MSCDCGKYIACSADSFGSQSNAKVIFGAKRAECLITTVVFIRNGWLVIESGLKERSNICTTSTCPKISRPLMGPLLHLFYRHNLQNIDTVCSYLAFAFTFSKLSSILTTFICYSLSNISCKKKSTDQTRWSTQIRYPERLAPRTGRRNSYRTRILK